MAAEAAATSVTTTTTTYSYFANFAVGLCEGPIGQVMRVWADGKPLDLAGISMRVYRGDEEQTPDPLIVAKDGEAPAYRGLAYVVFERLPVDRFGNRIPQLSFEIVRPVGALEQQVGRSRSFRARRSSATSVPKSCVRSARGNGPRKTATSAMPMRMSLASLDELQAVCPNIESVAIVVAWFGDDLRAGQCRIRPRVDNGGKQTRGASWDVAGLARGGADLVSMIEGRPAFGGTPSDSSVRNLIAELKGARAEGHALSFRDDGYSRRQCAGKSLYRCRAAAGLSLARRDHLRSGARRVGSPDGSAAAAAQIDAFFEGAGPSDWTYRRMVLHYASLAVAEGGVDAFLIGSELKGLTRVRSASGVYPAVDALIALAADVKAIVGGETKVTYGADWTEYGAHVVDRRRERGAISARRLVGVAAISMRSGSTITRRCRTGAMRPAISTAH